MLDLNFLFSFYFVLAIYMVAFLVNRSATSFLMACIASEFIGRFKLFSWALNYEYGVFMHLSWGLIYGLSLTFYYLSLRQLTKRNKLTMALVVLLMAYQLLMAIDCKWSEGNATILFDTYKYIIVVIHCCIVFTFIERGSFIKLLDELASYFRGFFGVNGYFMLYRYNNGNCKSKTGEGK